MTRSEYNAIRRRVYEARCACRSEAADDGRSSYGAKFIRELHVSRELQAALAADPRHWADKSITPYGYHDTRRYEHRAQVRRREILRVLRSRHEGKAETRDVAVIRMYLKPIKGN